MNVHKHTHTCDSLLYLHNSLLQLLRSHPPLFDSTFVTMTPFDGEELIVALGDRDKVESARRMQREDEGTKRRREEDRGRTDG